MKSVAGYMVAALLFVTLTGCQQPRCPKMSDAKSPVVCGQWATSDFQIVHMGDIKGIDCPCGLSRRAFVSPDNQLATLHKVDITIKSKTHYHKKLTEIYYILETEGDANMELNGKLYPVKAHTAILIKPGVRHRAVGKMKIINIPIPAFDPNDEWFD